MDYGSLHLNIEKILKSNGISKNQICKDLGKRWLISFILSIIPVCQVFIKNKRILTSYTCYILLLFILFWRYFLKMGTVIPCTQQSLLFCQLCCTLIDWHWQTAYGTDACFLRFHDIQLLSTPSASLQWETGAQPYSGQRTFYVPFSCPS